MRIPRHIAIIMDGNVRWAKRNQTSIYLAYKKGIKAAKRIIILVKIFKIQYITLYVFSIENWRRKISIVNFIINIFQNYIYRDIRKLLKKRATIIFIGNHEKLTKDLQIMMKYIEKRKEKGTFTLIIAISYSGKEEIMKAIRELNRKYHCRKKVKYMSLFQDIINPYNIPDPDLLIRTSGEKRISNFLLWQISYTELYFLKKLWPDFRRKDLITSIKDFNNRNRKYGK